MYGMDGKLIIDEVMDGLVGGCLIVEDWGFVSGYGVFGVFIIRHSSQNFALHCRDGSHGL